MSNYHSTPCEPGAVKALEVVVQSFLGSLPMPQGNVAMAHMQGSCNSLMLGSSV